MDYLIVMVSGETDVQVFQFATCDAAIDAYNLVQTIAPKVKMGLIGDSPEAKKIIEKFYEQQSMAERRI